MAEITAATVKDLRERSGAGMMDCKKALTETGGDMEAAIDWLRTKGLAAAAKKSSRTAAEGLVGVAVAGTKGAAVEVNSETDFVAKNDQFQDFVRNVTELALEHRRRRRGAARRRPIRAAAPSPTTLTANIATIGENQTLRRAKRADGRRRARSCPTSTTRPRRASARSACSSRSRVDAGVDVLEPLGKQLAMHIAAAFPQALHADELDQDVIERERAIATRKGRRERQARRTSSRRWSRARSPSSARKTRCSSQLFVMDNKTADRRRRRAGRPRMPARSIVLKDYVRFQLGEGIEKEESDFAAEVAAAAGVKA